MKPRPSPASPPTHAFAAEYQRSTGRPVEVTWRDAARQWMPAGPGSYVEWLEYELKTARRRLTEVRQAMAEMSAAAHASVRRLAEEIAGKEGLTDGEATVDVP